MVGLAPTMPCLQLLAMDLFPGARHGMASSCQGLAVQSGLNAWVAAWAGRPALGLDGDPGALGMLALHADRRVLLSCTRPALARRDGC